MLFRPKNQTYRAIQVNWANQSKIEAFLGNRTTYLKECTLDRCSESCGEKSPFLALVIYGKQGEQLQALHGEWILIDERDRLSVCLPHVFAAKFEPIE